MVFLVFRFVQRMSIVEECAGFYELVIHELSSPLKVNRHGDSASHLAATGPQG